MVLATHFYYPKWQQYGSEATISYDVSGYYLYLPALFIYDDLQELKFLPDILEQYHPTYSPYQAFPHESGAQVMKYSLGQAILYAPAFAVAHAYASTSESYPADGFSAPYQVALSVSSLLFAALGLLCCLLLLVRYFGPMTSAITLLLIVYGTNYLNYSAIDGAMTHNHVFTLYAILLLLTDTLYRRQSSPPRAVFLAIGAVIGLMALTRPTELLAVVIPLSWGVMPSREAIRERAIFLRRQLAKVVGAALVTLALGSLQLIYWRYVSGDWIVYSYQDQGFDWLHPHLINGLFSYKAGWLTYTPLMWFAVLGLAALYYRHPSLFPAVVIHFLLFIYVAFSWSVWWYGGSLGQRTMVQAYAVLSLPLAAAVGWALRRRPWVRIAFGGLALLCVAHNLWFTHAAHRGGQFVSEWMNGAYYWRTLFTFERKVDDLFLLDNPDFYRGTPASVDTIYRNDFEDEDPSACGLPAIGGVGSYCLVGTRSSTPEYRAAGPFEAGDYIRATATFATGEGRSGIHSSTQFVLRFYRDGRQDKYRLIRIHRALNDTRQRSFTLEAEVPRGGADEVALLVWNGGDDKSAVLLDDLVVAVVR